MGEGERSKQQALGKGRGKMEKSEKKKANGRQHM
jgi:hypothetical protein